jgi:hypothetical protein
MEVRTMRARLAWPLVAVAVLGLTACGDDDDDSGGGSGPTTADGGGGMSAGAPAFLTFEVSSSVPCQDGNATATMSFTTQNVVSIAIKIGDGSFEQTAGYGPNETDVVAEIPCTGAGESSIQLQGCTEDDECAESERKTVTITG